MPSLGQIVEGYLLIVPKAHFISMAHLPDTLFSELIEVKEHIRTLLTDAYATPLTFEHGPMSETERGGCCVDHAHFHVVPTNVDLLASLQSRFQGHHILELTDVKQQLNKRVPYLYYETQAGVAYIFDAPVVESQFLRRQLAKEVGVPDEWDWAVYPGVDRIKSTLALLQHEPHKDPVLWL
jgi:diadenosine tetraphosphate (Ap4A) HIT family hydrolase